MTIPEIFTLMSALFTVMIAWFLLADSFSGFDNTRFMYLKVKNLFTRYETYLVKEAPVTNHSYTKGELVVEEYGVIVPITCHTKISSKARRILESNNDVTTELYIICKIDDRDLRLVSFKEFKLKKINS